MKIEIEDVSNNTYKVTVDKQDSMYHGETICYTYMEIEEIIQNIIMYGM